MEIIEIQTADLIPYENNPRKNDNAVDAVAESIRQFGFKVPIVIDKEKVVVAGHTRLKAAQKLGIKVVPVICAEDLTEEQVKAFRLVDNKTAELAGWDFIKLREELAGIKCIDMEELGFENDRSFDVDEFFDDDAEEGKKPKIVRCPHCDEWVEVE